MPYGEDMLAPRGCGAVLVPWPNRLRGGQFTFEGRSLQLPITEPDKGSATHGLGRWTRWTAVRHEPADVTMSLDLVPQTGWPFEVRVDVTYALHPEHGLTVTAVAHNHGTGRAPFGAGFHPYLALRGATLDDVSLHLPAAHRLVMDETQLPVGVQPVGGTPYDFHAPRRLGTLRMDDEFTGLATIDGRGAVRRDHAVRRRPALVRGDLPLPAGLHPRRAAGHRPARHRRRADDLRRRRVQLRQRADRARAGRHLDRRAGVSPRSERRRYARPATRTAL